MGGLLTHFGAGLIGAIIIYFAFYKVKTRTKLISGGLFLLGNLLPDLVDFGVLGIQMGSLNPAEIMTNPLFDTLAIFGHTFSNWLIISLVFAGIILFIYEIEKISKKTLIWIFVAIILVLIGIFIHLRIDILIQEANYWI